MVGNHVIEHGAARIPGCIGGNSWRHASTLRIASRGGRGRDRCLTILHIYTVVKKKPQRGEGRPRSTHHIRSGSWCPTKSASLLASAGSGTQRRCCVQAVGFRGTLPETPGQKSRLFYLSAPVPGARAFGRVPLAPRVPTARIF